REELWGVFRGVADAGATLIVSSHVMDEALRCDRLLLMRAGRIIAHTTPNGLLTDTGQTDPDAAFLTLVQRDAEDHQQTRREYRERHGGEASV
ncbi:MAG: ABC transporter ATP-binding protein, partial [Rhodococcus sp.]|nr:ABC transporter ATP-binding protein [Rhodococcus sp. (in: high G+C Gram-positive bacteria)]